jgi:hypothetical protein
MTLSTENEGSLPEIIPSHWREFLRYQAGSLLLAETREGNPIVVGVPHHGFHGFTKMLCDRNADENAGYLGCYLAKKLNSSIIVANRYFYDPNKFETSDYFKFIESVMPDLVIEIHGHGARNALYDIEISSGPLEEEYARIFAEKLQKKMQVSQSLMNYTISGDYHEIYFTAQYSYTVTDTRWHTLHIELPPSLRKTQLSEYPPAKGFQLMDMIAEIIKDEDIDKKNNHIIM